MPAALPSLLPPVLDGKATTNDGHQSGEDIEKARSSSEAEPVPEVKYAGDVKAIDENVARGTKSVGVQKIEAMTSVFSKADWVLLYAGITLLGYVISLDGLTTFVYEAQATNSFSEHSLLATLNVVRTVIQAVSQPPLAKIADIWGRTETYVIAVFFYAIGYIIVASANNVQTYAGGLVLYQIGYTGILLMQEIVIADTTTLRNRLFWAIVPYSPFIINTWVSGNISQAILDNSSWRWGIGMFTILVPFTSIPIIATLSNSQRKASKAGKLVRMRELVREKTGWKNFAIDLFWQLDTIGLVLFVAGLSLILIAFTIANNATTARWDHADIIAMIVVGGLTTIAFIVYEYIWARHPIIPFKLMKDRTIVGGMGVAFWAYVCYYMANDFFYSYLLVAANQTTLSANRITSMWSFVSVITCLILGVIVRYYRHLKPFQLGGCALYTLGLGLMIRLRGTHDSAGSLAAVQIVQGLGAGLLTYPTQTAVQAAVKHEHMSLILATYLCVFYVGGAVGSSISGAMWSNILPDQLRTKLGNSALAESAYASPFAFIAQYPLGSPERNAVQDAYSVTQQRMLIAGTCMTVFLWASVIIMKNPRLEDRQTLSSVETDSVTSSNREGKGNAKEM